MKYTYKAKKDIQTVEGTIEAENSSQAIAKLEKMGYLPIKVEAQGHTAKKTSTVKPKPQIVSQSHSQSQSQSLPVAPPRRGAKAKISTKDLNVFTRQLASMMKSKVHLLKALEILSRETENEPLRKIVIDLRDEVKQGKQLSEALAKHPKHFSRVYTNMIASGEKGGVLDSMLLKLAEFADWEEDLRAKIQTALAYPLLMLVMGILSIFVMITFIMPKLTTLFTDIGQALPLPTQILISVSLFAQKFWYWIIGALIVAAIILKQLKIFEKNRVIIDTMLLNFPGIGKAILHREIARFCRTLSLLLSYGIPIRDAIATTVPTLGNRVLERDLGHVSQDLTLGLSVYQSFAKVKFFPGFVLSLISVGEEGGKLDDAFSEIAHTYERELDTEIKIFSALIEPILILSIGLVIAFIVMAMLLPIFDLNLK